MIAKLSGTVSEKFADSLLLTVGGIGYELFVTAEDWGAASSGDDGEFYVYEQIRDDAYNLYGFANIEAKGLFMQLLGVSGVGPKVAMTILSAASPTRLRQAIATGDPDMLKGISGVGKKTAERIIVELKGKTGLAAPTTSDQTFQALVGLGYSQSEAAEAVAALPTGLTDTAERVKQALKGMRR